MFEWFATGGRLTETLEKDIALGDVVQKKDQRICEVVQKGLQSPNYDRGRYSVRRENGVPSLPSGSTGDRSKIRPPRSSVAASLRIAEHPSYPFAVYPPRQSGDVS